MSVGCACADGRMGAQVCGRDGTFGPCTCQDPELERVRKGIVGAWLGTTSNPWTAPYQVMITFLADGHYSAHCAATACPGPVFYYGIDDDSPLKIYELRDVRADGTVTGRLTIIFFANETSPQYLNIDTASLSADGQLLKLEVWNGQYGPMRYDCKRVQ